MNNYVIVTQNMIQEQLVLLSLCYIYVVEKSEWIRERIEKERERKKARENERE